MQQNAMKSSGEQSDATQKTINGMKIVKYAGRINRSSVAEETEEIDFKLYLYSQNNHS